MFKIGDIVRHKSFGDIGVVIWVNEYRVGFMTSTGEWNTYHSKVEVLG